MSQTKFDNVFIGGGPGGYVAAIRSAQLGFNTACIEKRNALGGTCLNVGCIPSKALLESSHLFHIASHKFSEKGIEISAPKINIGKLMSNKENIVSSLTKGIEGLFKKNKITLINGEASFKNKDELEVKDSSGKKQIITAKNFIIATGSKVTDIPGVDIDEKIIVSSTGALSLKNVPKKMVVIGGGVIGLELGSVWSRFGCKVEVIEFMDRIIPGMDAEISKQFQKVLEKQGLQFKLQTKVTKVSKEKNKAKIAIESVNDSSKKEVIDADIVLSCVGRKPNTDKLGLENINIEINERGFIKHDGNFKTNIDNIYAIGDVTTGPMLAHKAEDEGIAVAEIIAGQAGHVNYQTIPNIIYTHPEVASVGATEEELKAANIDYKKGKFSMMANSRARATGDVEGFVKILACKKTDKVLGAHIIAREAGNMIHEIVTVMEFGGSTEDIARTCHGHPTFNEAIKEAALDLDGRVIHS